MRVFNLLMILALGVCCPGGAAETIAFWPFGEYGLNDASGHANTLVQTGVSIGETAVMDGNQVLFQTANALDLSSCEAVTVEFWIKVDPSGLNTSRMLLELTESANENTGAFMLDMHENPTQSDNAVLGMWRTDTSTGWSSADEPLNVPHILADCDWHHVAFIMKRGVGDTSCTTLYIDRTNFWSNASFYSQFNAGSGTTTFPGDKPLYIGSRANEFMKFKGEIDNVKISSGALLPSQFVNRDGTVDGPEIVAYYPFGAYAGTDATGHGHDLDVGGSVSFADGCANFDGDVSRLSSRIPIDLRNYGTGVTTEFWVKYNANTPSTGMMLLEHSPVSSAGGRGYCVMVNEVGTRVRLMQMCGNSFHVDDSADDLLVDGQWHHIAYVFDPLNASAEDRAALYIDRVKAPQNPGMVGAATELAKAHLFIGSRFNKEYRFVGQIDDVRITAGALSPDAFMTSRTEEAALPLVYWKFHRDFEGDAAYRCGIAPVSSGATFSDGVARLNGSASIGSASALPLNGLTGVTAECWIKTDDAADVPLASIFTFGANTIPGTLPGTNVWRHVAVVLESGTAKIFADHQYLGSENVEASLGTALQDCAFTVGDGFTGVLDDVRVTPAALTSRAMLQSHSDDAPLTIAYWKFDHQDIVEETGTYPVIPTVTPGRPWDFYDRAIEFFYGRGGKTQYPLTLSQWPTLTVELFFRSRVQDSNSIILELTDNSNAHLGAFTLAENLMGPGRPGACYKTSDHFDIRIAPEGEKNAHADGQWHKLTLTIDNRGGSSQTRFYYDGVERSCYPGYASTTCTPLADDILYFATRGNVNKDTPEASVSSFVGDLDEVRIVNTIITPDQMLSLDARRADVPAAIADWDFADDGNPLADKSGNGHTLEGTAAIVDGVAQFANGTCLSTVDTLDLTPYRQLTFEAVVKHNDPSHDELILEHSNNYAENDGSLALYFNGDTTERPGSVDGASRGAVARSRAHLAHDTRWHHYAVTVDYDAGNARARTHIYVDGELADDTYINWYDPTTQKGPGNHRFFIGSRNNETAFLNGVIGRVRITDRVLSPKDFLARPAAALADDAVVAYWPFTGAATWRDDVSGNGYDLSDAVGVAYDSSNACADFSSGHGPFRHRSPIDLSQLPKLTVECFLKTEALGSVNILGNCAIDNTGTPDGGFNLGTYHSPEAEDVELLAAVARPYAYYKENNFLYTATDILLPERRVNDGRWHHVAYVIDRSIAGSGGLHTIYVDGVARASRVMASPLKMSSLLPFEIGSAPGADSATTGYVGQIDDVRITADALTPERFLARRSSGGGTVIYVR